MSKFELDHNNKIEGLGQKIWSNLINLVIKMVFFFFWPFSFGERNYEKVLKLGTLWKEASVWGLCCAVVSRESKRPNHFMHTKSQILTAHSGPEFEI